jgi:hypothetical protein
MVFILAVLFQLLLVSLLKAYICHHADVASRVAFLSWLTLSFNLESPPSPSPAAALLVFGLRIPAGSKGVVLPGVLVVVHVFGHWPG